MKKLGVSILLLVYFVSITGATVHMHYCMGKLADWSLVKSKSDICSRCGMEKSQNQSNGCCKDVQKLVKTDHDQKTPEQPVQFVKLLQQQAQIPGWEFSGILYTTPRFTYPVCHAPPQTGNETVYILNCTFLI